MKKETQPNKSFRVCKGTACVTVFPWIHPTTGKRRWRFAVEDSTAKGGWRYKTRKTKDEAKAAAEKVLEQQGKGLVWELLTPARQAFLERIHKAATEHDEAALLAFLESRSKSGEIVAAVDRFVAHKKAEAGEETPHLRQVKKHLEALGKHFAGRMVVEVHQPELAEWWEARGAGLADKTRKDIRANLVMFWNWCQREGIAGNDPVTVAERLPVLSGTHGARVVLTPEKLRELFGAVREEWRVWVVLGAFAGMRPEEIAPSAFSKKKDKRGLHCEEIDWRFGVIRVPGIVSKVGIPRIVPMNEALRAGLEWAGIQEGMTGPVCLKNPTDAEETGRLGKAVFGGKWPQDALRHSFGSYRNALVRSLPQVAEEMGTSVAMMHRHYHNPKPEEEGREWFSVRPRVSIAAAKSA